MVLGHPEHIRAGATVCDCAAHLVFYLAAAGASVDAPHSPDHDQRSTRAHRGCSVLSFQGIDYSIFRAAKEVSYVPLGFDERYRAKEVIDVFGYRTGEGGSSVAIVLLQKAGVVMSNYYLAIAFSFVVFWLELVFPATSEKREGFRVVQ